MKLEHMRIVNIYTSPRVTQKTDIILLIQILYLLVYFFKHEKNEWAGILDVLDTIAKIATICGAIIALIALFHQISSPRRRSTKKSSFSLDRKETKLVLCMLLFFFLGIAFPQAIIPIFLALLIIVYKNMPRSTNRALYTFSLLVITLAGLAGAYLSAYNLAADAGMPLFYDHDFRVLDIWYLLN